MTRNTANLLCAAMIAASLIAGALALPNLPEQVPTHWNAAGEVDGYSNKWLAVALGPLMGLLMWGTMWIIPYISPKGFRTDQFAGIVHLLKVVLVLFSIVIGGMILLAGFGREPSVERFVPIAIGGLFIVLGNYMGKLRKNFFIGIRTPWTLASDEVWAKTHRIGGYLFVAAGFVSVGGALLGFGLKAIMTASLAAVLVPVIYSFIAYKRIEGFSPD